MNTRFLFLLLIIFSLNSFAQKSHDSLVADGELLVQMQAGFEADLLQELFQEDYQLEVLEKCSDVLNVWRVKFNSDLCQPNNMFNLVLRNQAVQTVQYNHIIKMRETLPNDFVPWPLHTVQLPDAWDYDTGDTTAFGDKIVIAIVDGFFDLDDADSNYYTNPDEIPNNGIDDDNNGYIDDVNGWHIVNDDGKVDTTSGHGHSVSMRASSLGNNGMGSAGVNWDIPALPLHIFEGTNSLESRALAALDYMTKERKLYNDTNGAEGAFIVASNHSYGGAGFEINAPLWCAAYDTAGAVGIIACGATTNGSVNVDVAGDLPTTCSQSHFIGVTQTTQNDVLDAGYGAINIDLGSPSEGSTSMATPMVTASVAFLLSAACPSFVQAYKNDPDNVSLLLKDYILAGVDLAPSLIGTTLTGGRLNTFNSMAIMLSEQCGQAFPPISAFTFDDQSVCVGEMVNFIDQSQLLPNQWDWTFAGGNPASSTAQNPSVLYSTPGTYDVNLTVTNFDGSSSSNVTGLITVSDVTGLPLPYSQDFEIGNDWTVTNPNGDAAWTLTFNDACHDTVIFMDNFGDNNAGTLDYLEHSFDLTGMTDPILVFDLAYARYNPNFFDQLDVVVQTCGLSDSLVYSKNDSILATADDINSSFVPANCDDWRQDTIDLSHWQNQTITIQFVNVSNWGNNLYLDNIQVKSSENRFELNAKVLLEGNYMSAGQMDNGLISLIPLSQPYSVAPYNYSGLETLTTVPTNMVDWILVEARSGTPNLSGLRNTVTVQTLAGILLQDGNIVGVDGLPLNFSELQFGEDYYFCVRHRNHLDILSANPIAANENMAVDFTSAINSAFGVQQKNSFDNFALMFAGDYNQDGTIQVTDYDLWKLDPAILNTYNPMDGNLDGTVQLTDYDTWYPNSAINGIAEIGY